MATGPVPLAIAAAALRRPASVSVTGGSPSRSVSSGSSGVSSGVVLSDSSVLGAGASECSVIRRGCVGSG